MTDNKITLNALIEWIGDETDAEAAVGQNPYFQWAKIIVTDDQPNLNKQRIPSEEFDNLIKTGIFTPIKMTYASISKGHKEAFGKVIGTVTQLAKETTEDGRNVVVALAALWKKERENDIAMLKDMFSRGTPPTVSWEVAFANSQKDDDGIESLYSTSLTGIAVVSNPAYADRAKFVAMASEGEEDDFVEELEQLKQANSQLEEKLTDLQTRFETQETELAELRDYKKKIEDAQAAETKFASIRTKFTEAGVEKDEEYFSTNRDKLLALDEATLDFMIQEFAAFQKKIAESSVNEDTKSKVPPMNGNGTSGDKLTPRQLGQALREEKIKK